MFIFDLIGIVVGLLTVIIVYCKWRFQYWKRRGIPFIEPSILSGSFGNPFRRKEHLGFLVKRQYDKMKSRGWKHGGLFLGLKPTYLAVDLNYIKNILIKDFQYFTDRGLFYNEEDDPLSAHLFALGGPKWRNLRTKLSPTFTSGKMKAMFQTLLDCEPYLRQKMDSDVAKKNAIDIKETLGCFTTDIIGSCAFGLDCKTFQEEKSPFREYGKKIFERTTSRILKFLIVTNFPSLGKIFKIKTTPQDVEDFFMKVVSDTVNYREKNNVTGKDFMQLLIDLKNNKLAHEEGFKHDGNTLTMAEITAQSFVFFIAGFETSSTTMSFALYELARNQDLQEKVRDEIKAVLGRHEGKITYDAVHEMKYMDQVINETLRKYPPVAFVSRKCVKDYKIPDEDAVIEKDTFLLIPILSIHYDKDYYPDPDTFDPERFNEENMASRHNCAHIPFGEGPRLCIGMRFGLMQTKVGLTSLLQNYKFTVNSRTKEPLHMKPRSIVLAAEGEIWLDAQKISKR